MVSYLIKPSLAGYKWEGLNPYCSGQWSRTSIKTAHYFSINLVLILIVVDNGLVPDITIETWMQGITVLILIVVDNGLVLDLIRLY